MALPSSLPPLVGIKQSAKSGEFAQWDALPHCPPIPGDTGLCKPEITAGMDAGTHLTQTT